MTEKGAAVESEANRTFPETSDCRRRRRRNELSYEPKKKLREVDVYETDYGTEIFKVDGWVVEQNITPGDVCFPSALDVYKSGFRKVRTSRPPSPPRPLYSAEENKEGMRRQTVRAAEAALEYYNKKHHADYELVDPIISNSCCHPDGMWRHCNFTAKAASQGRDGDSSTKLFFAEEKKVKLGGFVVTACYILDGRKTTDSCGICEKLTHPTRGFLKGLYHNESRVLRSLTRGLAS